MAREYTGDGIGNKDVILLALVAKRITEAGRIYCNAEIQTQRRALRGIGISESGG